ncbi:hypothetical protein EGW08_023209 [Elysia chlorotica]|uniref:Uncharacterized protein n=1 Tax=Elysia chlorotica TaxID=188477 RepID=A0A433SJ21_ELYCH|nr:hypothetical protein EGW08_023209 [Elysia chlorotica]
MSGLQSESILKEACEYVIEDLSTYPNSILVNALKKNDKTKFDKAKVGGCYINNKMQKVEFMHMPSVYKTVWASDTPNWYSICDDRAAVSRDTLLLKDADRTVLPWEKRFDQDNIDNVSDDVMCILYSMLTVYLVNDSHVFASSASTIVPWITRIEHRTVMAYQVAHKCENAMHVKSLLIHYTSNNAISEMYAMIDGSTFSKMLSQWTKLYIENSRSIASKLAASVIIECILNQPLMALAGWME